MGYSHYCQVTKKISPKKWGAIVKDVDILFEKLPKASKKSLISQGTNFDVKNGIFIGCYESELYTPNVKNYFHKTARTAGDEFTIGVFWLYKYHCPHIVEVASDGSIGMVLEEYRDTIKPDKTMMKAWRFFKKVFPAYAEKDMEKFYFAELVK